MYEYSADDVERKFSNQICLLEAPNIPKNFYYLTRRDAGWYVYDKNARPVSGALGFSKLKFTYHRFSAGFYPTLKDSNRLHGYALLYRNAENRVYTHGLGAGAYAILGDVRDPTELYALLKGSFSEPDYYKTIDYSGALSSLYRKSGNTFYDIFGNKIATHHKESNSITIWNKQQEFYDLLQRNHNYGVANVIEG
jgi:hypothetical protein